MKTTLTPRIKTSLISAVRVFCYAALTTWIGMTMAGGAGVGDVPDVNTLKRTAIAASWSGLTALTAFAWNLARPRSDIPPGK